MKHLSGGYFGSFIAKLLCRYFCEKVFIAIQKCPAMTEQAGNIGAIEFLPHYYLFGVLMSFFYGKIKQAFTHN